jgi:hypothetical protein
MNTHKQLYHDYLRLFAFAHRFLDPEQYGYKVSAEIRDAAREALGLPKVEARQPSVTQPETYSQSLSDVYGLVEQAEFERNDK